MTGEDISKRARALIDDDGAGGTQREQDPEGVMWINDAVSQIWRGRTDSQYKTDGTMLVLGDIKALTETVTIYDEWREACAHYVAARMLARRSGEADNVNRIVMLKAQFKALTGLEM